MLLPTTRDLAVIRGFNVLLGLLRLWGLIAPQEPPALIACDREGEANDLLALFEDQPVRTKVTQDTLNLLPR